MRFLTSFAVISIAIMGAAIAQTSRARPGSVTGAATAAAQAAATSGVTVQKTNIQTARVSSPVTGNPMAETARPDGTLIFTDMANGEMWVYDAVGILVRYAPNPEDEEVPLLGVSVGTARRACLGIYADGHQAVFDEASMECLVPVVAHNWNGVIKSSGRDVVAWAKMGDIVRCNAKSFEQISVMRRSSQWVVPLMVVGGAGVGAGVGYLVGKGGNDNNNEQQAATSGPIQVGDFWYDISVDVTLAARTGSKESPFGRDKLADVLAGTGGGNNANGAINAARVQQDLCVGQMFQELTSGNMNGTPKFGNLRITTGLDCDKTPDDKYPQTGVLVCQKGNTSSIQVVCVGGEKPGGFQSTGKCYYRDGFGAVTHDATTTASFDGLRGATIRAHMENQEFKGFDFHDRLQNSGCTFEIPSDKNGRVLIKCSEKTFGQIANGFADKCDSDKFGNAYMALQQKIGAASALQAFMETNPGATRNGLTKAQLDAMLAAMVDVEAGMGQTAAIKGGTAGGGGDPKWYSWNSSIGKGMYIGAGVGALAGVGYFFAEGKSVFCNVGGICSPKLDKSCSIPSFRDYIIKHNYVNWNGTDIM
ncbi:MAG: hypothetical protein FWG39_03905 [Alphaproteobacteria bacterium]|nr:hypothetical protein [Alphaproteobacteria bacterium]